MHLPLQSRLKAFCGSIIVYLIINRFVNMMFYALSDNIIVISSSVQTIRIEAMYYWIIVVFMWYYTEIIFQNVILYNILASKEKFTTNRICAKTIINANAYASQRSECWSESSCTCILCVCDQISCVGPYICIFIFYTQLMQRICLSVSVRLSQMHTWNPPSSPKLFEIHVNQ